MTIKFYNDNAESFYAATVNVDMSDLHRRFTDYLPKGALILDGGCGSGRDSLAFMEHGFLVDAFDASEAMVAKAIALTGLNVQLKRFDELKDIERYDGIWTCASLLHVPRVELLHSMNALHNSLKRGGIWYLSFKHGIETRVIDGRLFTDMNESNLSKFFNELGGLKILDMWVTGDKRSDRDDRWLNAIVKKC